MDTTESVYHIPATMLTEPSQMVYEKGVRHAEAAEDQLRRAVSVYHKKLGDNIDRPEMKNRRQLIRRNAAAQFWTDIEQAVPRLLEVAAAPESLGLKGEWRKTSWGQSVQRAARGAYERACPHNTARQIRAYALGLKILFAAPRRKQPKLKRRLNREWQSTRSERYRRTLARLSGPAQEGPRRDGRSALRAEPCQTSPRLAAAGAGRRNW